MSAAEVSVQGCFRSWLAQKGLNGPSCFPEKGWHIPAAIALYKGWLISEHWHALLAIKSAYLLKVRLNTRKIVFPLGGLKR